MALTYVCPICDQQKNAYSMVFVGGELKAVCPSCANKMRNRGE